jgi:hypothetical protein
MCKNISLSIPTFPFLVFPFLTICCLQLLCISFIFHAFPLHVLHFLALSHFTMYLLGLPFLQNAWKGKEIIDIERKGIASLGEGPGPSFLPWPEELNGSSISLSGNLHPQVLFGCDPPFSTFGGSKLATSQVLVYSLGSRIPETRYVSQR